MGQLYSNKIIMCRRSLYKIVTTIIIFSCNDPQVSYKNNLGIDPGVIALMDSAHYTRIEWETLQKDFGKGKQGDSIL